MTAVSVLQRARAAVLEEGPKLSEDQPRALLELPDEQIPELLQLAHEVRMRWGDCLQDATARRGANRNHATTALPAQIHVIDAGHCLHRDAPADWLQAITAFTAAPPKRAVVD
jgi:pimeloyl-ACP methyl ester carboxylesterase